MVMFLSSSFLNRTVYEGESINLTPVHYYLSPYLDTRDGLYNGGFSVSYVSNCT